MGLNYDCGKISLCKYCGRSIVWTKLKSGKWHPVDCNENGRYIEGMGNHNNYRPRHECHPVSERVEHAEGTLKNLQNAKAAYEEHIEAFEQYTGDEYDNAGFKILVEDVPAQKAKLRYANARITEVEKEIEELKNFAERLQGRR